jgi:branched-chain amino acid transport system substrate-binding protein
MTSRRRFIKSSVAAAGLTSIAGCLGGSFGGGGTQYEQAIGAPTPQSGPIATSGQAGIRGMRIAATERSEDIALELSDGQGSPEAARSVVEDMLSNGVPAITGTFSSDVSIALSDLAERESVPFVTAISGAPEVTGPDDEFTFRMAANTYQQCKGCMEFWRQAGAEKVAVLAADYSYGQSVLEYVANHASDYGLELVYETLLPVSTNNFTPALREVPTDEVDAVLFPFPGGNSPTLVNQARQQGFFEDIELVTGFNSHGTELFRQALGEGILGLYTWSVDLESDRSRQASELMREEHDVPMDALSLPNYDAFHMIADAMQSTDTLTPEGIRDELRNTDYRAASGYEVSFDDAGDNTQYRMVVGRWEEVDGVIRNVPQYTTDTLAPTEDVQ